MAGVVSAILRLKKEEEVGQRGCRGADSFSNTLEAVGLANSILFGVICLALPILVIVFRLAELALFLNKCMLFVSIHLISLHRSHPCSLLQFVWVDACLHSLNSK